MAYFDLFPDLLLPSFTDNRNSSYDYVRVKNLFKRAKIRDDFFQNAVVFDKYAIVGDDRPDNVAYKIYRDASLDWVILLSNNILNIQTEWPLTQYDFDNLADRHNYPHSSQTYNSVSGIAIQGVRGARIASETRPKNMKVTYVIKVC